MYAGSIVNLQVYATSIPHPSVIRTTEMQHYLLCRQYVVARAVVADPGGPKMVFPKIREPRPVTGSQPWRVLYPMMVTVLPLEPAPVKVLVPTVMSWKNSE